MKRRPVIYVAGPITHGGMGKNIRRALVVADLIVAAGCVPFVPHLNHFWDLISPKVYETWMQLDFEMIGRSDALVRLPGESSGADREVSLASERGKPSLILRDFPPAKALRKFCASVAADFDADGYEAQNKTIDFAQTTVRELRGELRTMTDLADRQVRNIAALETRLQAHRTGADESIAQLRKTLTARGIAWIESDRIFDLIALVPRLQERKS